MVTPDGKVLGFHYYRPKPGESYAEGQNRWVRETVETVRTALKQTAALPPRELKANDDPFPDRGKGTSADGGARLAVSVIQLRNGRQEGPPVIDSIFLNREQWANFRPPPGEMRVGRQWTVAEEAADRFAPAFSPMTDSIFSPKPDDVTKATVTAKIERLGEGYAVIRYSGTWETFHNRDGNPRFPIRTTATGEGVGVYDTQSRSLTAIAWFISGTFRNSPPGDRPQPTAAVVDWTSGAKGR